MDSFDEYLCHSWDFCGGNHFGSYFFHYSANSTSVAIIYVLAVMLIARYTTGYVPGIVASFIGVICVNYVFTYPFMR